MRGFWASGTRAHRARSRRCGSGGGEKGVGARAVGSSACPGLAGILFWSRGRVERAWCVAGGRWWWWWRRLGARQSCARTRGRGGSEVVLGRVAGGFPLISQYPRLGRGN